MNAANVLAIDVECMMAAVCQARSMKGSILYAGLLLISKQGRKSEDGAWLYIPY